MQNAMQAALAQAMQSMMHLQAAQTTSIASQVAAATSAVTAAQMSAKQEAKVDENNSRKNIPAEVQKKLEVAALKHERKVEKFLKAKRRMEKNQKNMDIFSADASFERYPPGSRPFGSCPTFEELDVGWSKCIGSDFEFKVMIKQGATRREAMRAVHWHTAKHLLEVETEAQNEHVNATKAEAGKAKFFEALVKALTESQDAEKAASLGLDQPLTKELDRAWVEQKFEAMYRSMCTKIVKADEEEKEKKRKAETDKEEKEKALVYSKPDELLCKLMQKVADNDMMVDTNDEESTAQMSKSFVEALQKNSLSPPAAAGAKHAGGTQKKVLAKREEETRRQKRRTRTSFGRRARRRSSRRVRSRSHGWATANRRAKGKARAKERQKEKAPSGLERTAKGKATEGMERDVIVAPIPWRHERCQCP